MTSFLNAKSLSFTRARYWGVPLICAVIVVLAFWKVLLPTGREWLLAKQQEQVLRRQLQTLYQKGISLEEEMAQIPRTRSALSEWQKKFIKYDDMNKLSKEIMAMGKRDQLQVLSFYPNSSVMKEKNYFRQSFRMTLNGSYTQIAHFIEQVATLPWTVVVGNFLLARVSDEVCSVEMVLYVYYLP